MTQSIFIPRVAYQPSFDSNGNLLPTTPMWDWLGGICNPYTSPQTVQLHFIDGASGIEISTSPISLTIEPGTSNAFSLIAGNGLPAVPGPFAGYVRIDFIDMTGPFGTVAGMQLPFASAIGGDGPGALNWNYGAATCDPVFSNQVSYGKMSRMVFPYAIPFYMDPFQHAGTNEYRTSLSITNLDTVVADLTISYIVDQDYPNAGQTFTTTVSIQPNTQYNSILAQTFPQLMTLNFTKPGAACGSEGWINITSSTPVNIMAWELVSNRDFDLMGIGFRPWIIQ